jgi:hypothetical protein
LTACSIAGSSNPGTRHLADIARRILTRELPKSIDVESEFPEDQERQRRLRHRLDREFSQALNSTVLRDEAVLSLYGEIGADDTKAQKRLMIMLPNGDTREITDFRDAMVKGSPSRTAICALLFP